MAKFTFSLPNGQLFSLNGPAGATLAQAEFIFTQQLAAGTLVGLRAGDKIESTKSQIIEFTQSRLDRGTAGVPDFPLLAIVDGQVISTMPSLAGGQPVTSGGQPVTSGTTGVPGIVPTSNTNSIVHQDPDISEGPYATGTMPLMLKTAQTACTIQSATPETQGIGLANYATQKKVTQGLGPLTASQVQSLVAQAAVAANQPSNVLSSEGVGKYKFTGPQLEAMGYLKPGTSCRYLDLCNDDSYQAPEVQSAVPAIARQEFPAPAPCVTRPSATGGAPA